MKTLLVLTLCLAALPAFAADVVSERKQLAQQRSEIEARFAAEAKACTDRFVVNACLDDVHARRATALRPIVAREQEVDAAERQARATAQRERVRQRQQDAGSSDAAHRTEVIKQSIDPQTRVRAEAKPHAVITPEQRRKGIAAKTEASEEQAELNRQRQANHAAELDQRRKDAAKREALRLGKTKGKVATPLPKPTEAEIAKLKASVPASAASR
ncbi:MAG TPA: hypothetical protein VGM81_18175 [Burkholderiaceae bacterium]|jgi:hypothetical protein